MLGCLTIDRRRITARSRGFTLIELLVVVFIVLAVSALSVAMVVPSLEQRQVREASLSMTSYLNGVRAEAVRTGRPVGVWIERAEGVLGDRYATRMYRCNIPPAFGGTTLQSRVYTAGGDNLTAWSDTNTGPVDNVLTLLNSSSEQREFWGNYISVGDLIRFNYQGNLYRIVELRDEWDAENETANPDTDKQPDQMTIEAVTFGAPDLRLAQEGAVFEVLRQPRMGSFARSAGMPLVLPPGVVIDLSFSGDDHGPFHLKENGIKDASAHPDPYVGESQLRSPVFTEGDRNPVIIMFGKTGAVDAIYHTEYFYDAGPPVQEWANLVRERVTGPIYFLLGRLDKAQSDLTIESLNEVALEDASDDTDVRRRQAEQVERFNLFDLNNLWITIDPRTGTVTSSEMAVADPWQVVDPPTDEFHMDWRVEQARAFARSSRGQGGG